MRVESCTATNGQDGDKETTLKLIEEKLVALCEVPSHSVTVVSEICF